MNAMAEPIAFQLPKKPRIKEKDAPPDQRKFCVLPVRAVFDKKLTHGALQVLAALCSYCNRAGLTWVSQTRLASDLGISQQAVAKQFKQLREHGYVETVRKGFKGERTDTLRVIFDPTVSAEDAIAMTSNKEDTRPPSMQEDIDPEGQRRVAQLIAKALKQPTKPKGYEMPKSGDTRAVREVKEAMAKARAKRSKSVDNHVDQGAPIHNSQVVNAEPLHSQPNHNLEVVQNTKNIGIDRVFKDSKVKDKLNNKKTVLNNLDVSDFDSLIDAGMKPEQVEDCANTLLPLFAAEGLNPSSRVLADSILQLHRDAR